MTLLAPIVQAFFTTRLAAQYGASGHTVAAYRDTWRLLLRYAADRTGTPPSALDLGQVDADVVGGFLDWLETVRGNTASTRNARLAAVHSLFGFASYQCPEHADTISRILAIPAKRAPRREITYLTAVETAALLDAPDQSTPAGRRDHALIQTAVTCGMRVAELTGLRTRDVHLGAGAHVVCHGKGRKDRATPLDRQTARVLREPVTGAPPDAFVFPSRTGGRLSHDAVATRLALHVAVAARSCPTLHGKHVTPHVLRHTAAMRLLHAGVDTTVIALWLGHESTETTQIYLHADMDIKQRALDRTAPTGTRTGRYKPDDTLLAFLQSL